MKKFITSLIIGSAFTLAACGEAVEDVPGTDITPDADVNADAAIEPAGTITDIAAGNPDFSTLVTAVTAADLGATLSGEGPFTVFAPTNAAFDALPAGVVDDLVANDTETLGSILTYHVVSGAVDAATLTGAIEAAGEEGHTIETVNGATLTAVVIDGAVVLRDATGNSATVTDTDISASNGLIHVIDTVLMPM